MKRAVAMVLAGGQGKRMDILCHRRPKPVLPFAGRFRVIDFSLSNCMHSEIADIAVLVDYQRHYMADYLQQWRATNGSNVKLDILEPRSGPYKGTADAVYQNLDYIAERNANTVVVLAGDHVYRIDYRKMLAFHQQAGADATVGVIRVPIEQAHRFGIVDVGAGSRIVDFVEKPKNPPSNLASMGIYIFNKAVLEEHLVEDSAQPASPHDFGHVIVPRMVKRNKVFAYRFDGYWQDIGTVEAYYEANMELLRELPSLSLNGHWPIRTCDNNGLPPRLLTQGTVKGSFISPGCVIKGKVESSILCPGVRVEEQAVVRNSLVMANTCIGKHSVIDRCIVDEDVNVGEFCYIGFGGSLIPGSWDITVLGKGVTVPTGTAIGRSCRVLPGVAAADFSANAIPSGSVVPC